jgi:hypothetical protein
MTTLPILDELPSGYFVDESPGGVLVLHAEVTRALHEAGFGPEQDGELLRSDLSGRRSLYELDTDLGRFVVRRFSHGGLMRWFTGVRYHDPERPFRELILAASLRRAGIPTPQVVAARARMAFGGGWYLDIVTRRVAEAIDLGYILGQVRAGQLEPDVCRRLLRSTGTLVRRLHRHGCLHADLTPSNILVERSTLEESEPRLWVIDLDQSRHLDDLTLGDRHANLRRLYRYTVRRERRFGRALRLTDFMRFLVAYEPDRHRRATTWRAIAAAHKRNWLFHSLGWLFEGWFARRVDPREVTGG